MAPRGKIVRSTAAQITLLVDYMAEHPLFAAGEFTGPLGAQKIEAEWAKLKTSLANYGPDKSIDQWKHTWRDLKKKAREVGGQVRIAKNTTGNMVPIPELSEKTKKILGTIGNESATGITSEEETGIGCGILFDSQPGTSTSENFNYVVPEPNENENPECEVQSAEHIHQAASYSSQYEVSQEAQLVQVPRRQRVRTARLGSQRRTQPPSQEFIAAHKGTNRILQELVNMMPQLISAINNPRRRSQRKISAFNNLKF